MTDPVRLMDGDDAVARRLTRAMLEEHAPPDGASRTMVALGLVAGVGAVTSAASTASALVASSEAGTVAGGVGAAGWSAVLAKWFAGGASLGLVVAATGTAAFPNEDLTEVDRPALSSPAVAAPVQPTARPVLAPTPPEDDPDTIPLQPEATPRSTSAGSPLPRAPLAEATEAPASAAFPDSPADALAAEVASLDRARQALGRGAFSEALKTLDDHARQHPRGRLFAEALVLRIDALMRLGRRDEARALARAHLQSQPRSPHAARLRALTQLEEN